MPTPANIFTALYTFRFDRGFDPRSEIRQARFDEYLLRYTPFDEPVLNLQVGKFATVVGNWVQRHLSWDNPFINAPLPYENIAIVSDQLIVPGTPAFLRRQQSPDNKPAWLPIIWGPDYASGASVFGSIAKFDYAFEIKNAALASHPELWDARDIGWEYPTFSGRLGLRPATEWNVGTSFSYGHYLSPEAEDAAAFPSGKSLGDFHQLMVGSDLSYAWHHLQLWAELFLSALKSQMSAMPIPLPITSKPNTKSPRNCSLPCAGTSSSLPKSPMAPAPRFPGIATSGELIVRSASALRVIFRPRSNIASVINAARSSRVSNSSPPNSRVNSEPASLAAPSRHPNLCSIRCLP